MKFIALLSIFALSTSAFAQLVKPMDDLFAMNNRLNAGKDGATITRESLANYDKFVAMDVNALQVQSLAIVDAKKLKFLTKNQAEIAIRASQANPVASTEQYHKYDPRNQGIGFCFGRATFVNLYLAAAGVNRANIKKAFIVGRMDGGAWGWHVTTIVESRNPVNGKEMWLALDPISQQGIQDVRSWYKEMSRKSDDGKLRLYIGEAGKLGAGASRYDEISFADPFYNNYFKDMRSWFEKNDVSKDLK